MTSTVTVEVNVTDINDNNPIFKPQIYIETFPEDVSVGTEITTVSATDIDSGNNGTVMYTLVSGNENGEFDCDENTGKVTFKKSVDFENKKSYTLTISATDKGSPSRKSIVDAIVNVSITDVNDNKPVFNPVKYEKSVSESREIGFLVVTVTATDKDSNANGMVMYSITDGNNENKFEVDMVRAISHSSFHRGTTSQLFWKAIILFSRNKSITQLTVTNSS